MPWPDLVTSACGIGRSGGNPQDETPTKRKTPLWSPSIAAQASDDDSEDMINPQIVTQVQNNDVYKKCQQQQQPNRSFLSSFVTDSPAGSRKDTSAGSGNTNPNQGSNSSSISNSPQHSTEAVAHEDDDDAAMDRFWQQAVGSFWTSSQRFNSRQSYEPLNRLSDMVHEACTSSPCSPRDLARELYPCDTEDEAARARGGLGISPLHGPKNASPAEIAAAQKVNTYQQMDRTHEEIEVSTSHHIQVRLPPQDATVAAVVDMATSCGAANTSSNTNGKTKKKRSSKKKKNAGPTRIPLQTLEVKTEEAAALERSISELTMRSSYAAAHAAANSSSNPNAANNTSSLPQVPDKSRRMAYYAVGKHHRNAGRGGNRRCYFTGKLILGGAPFYAGSVQQGLRTLVVFCLPSAVGLPDKDALLKYSLTANEMKNSGSSSGKGHRRIGSNASRNGTILSVQPVNGRTGSLKSASNRSTSASVPLQMDTTRGLLLRGTGRSCAASVASKSMTSKVSRLSSLDDMSLSIEGDLDPNWGLDRDVLLAVLPTAGPDLLKQMADHYPEQFETLPMQVREPSVWKLYVKFCFFSGLPIAEGELHYKVVDDIAEQVYGEEIALSHDVMEAATGKSSAEILALPNRIVLNYIRKHYPQQCSKLEDRVFVRSSWERVSPEV